MNVDSYTRATLTVIAIALVYLCVVLTPLPPVQAQRAARPGDDTGPAQVVIVGWKANDRVPVQVLDSITLKTTGEMRVTGSVQTEPKRDALARVVLAGWEENGTERSAGALLPLTRDARTPGLPPGIPVTTVPTR